MISHVYDNVSESKLLSSVSVATCDKIIFDHINKNGGSAVMTSDIHEGHQIDVLKHFFT